MRISVVFSVLALILTWNIGPSGFSDRIARAADLELEGNTKVGRTFAERICADCHEVRAQPPLTGHIPLAPDFWTIAHDNLTTAFGLNAFLVSPHANMPNLILQEPDRRNVIAYILSLRTSPKKNPT